MVNQTRIKRGCKIEFDLHEPLLYPQIYIIIKHNICSKHKYWKSNSLTICWEFLFPITGRPKTSQKTFRFFHVLPLDTKLFDSLSKSGKPSSSSGIIPSSYQSYYIFVSEKFIIMFSTQAAMNTFRTLFNSCGQA